MKQTLLAALFSLSVAATVQAQTNSVALLDGSGTLILDTNSISNAYAMIPNTVTQAYTIEVRTTYTGASEFYPIIFLYKVGASATNTITLRPEASATNIDITGFAAIEGLISLINAHYVIIDGRPGGTGSSKAFTVENTDVTFPASAIELDYSSTNNIIKYCNITGSQNIGVNMAYDGGGNSNNLIEHVTFDGMRYGYRTAGVSTLWNENNTVKSCEFLNIEYLGIWAVAYNGLLTIDSNLFYDNITVTPYSNTRVGILVQNQADSIIITRNHVFNQNIGNTAAWLAGISFYSTTYGAGSAAYSYVANNMILIDGNGNADLISGIEYGSSSATYPFNGRVFNNTVKIGGTAVGGTSGEVNSSPVRIGATNSFDNQYYTNNILLNERTGGSELHLAVQIVGTTGDIITNYNTYATADTMFGTYGANDFPDFASFQTFVYPNETYGNADPVTFVGGTNLHLDASMYNVYPIYGTPTSVAYDIDGEARLMPFRGYDEIILDSCTGMPDGGDVYVTKDTVCKGDSLLIYLTGQTGAYGLSYQWQSRPSGGSFTNLSNDTTLGIFVTIDSLTEFRCIVTCDSSGLSDTSTIGSVAVYAPPQADSIAYTNVLNTFTFTIANEQYTNDWFWDFGDGNDTIDTASVVHTYAESGVYTVMLILTNECESDTLYTEITVDCFGTPATATARGRKAGTSQPLNTQAYICPGENAMLVLSGLNTYSAPYYDYQWQASVGGSAYTDVAGATDDTLIISPALTTDYRCVVSCAASSTSKNSSVVKVNVQIASFDSITATPITPMYEFQFTVYNPQSLLSFIWDFGDGSPNSNLQNPTHSYAEMGTYMVKFYGQGVCDVYSDSIEVTVECFEAPIAGSIDHTATGTSVNFSSNGGTSGATYTWDFGDGTNGSGATATHKYVDEDGTYTVTLIVSNGCGADTVTTTISVVGIAGVNTNSAKLFPNPTNDITVIRPEKPFVNAQLVIRNASGQVVYVQTGVTGEQVSLSAKALKLASGTYFVECVSAGTKSMKTWIVE